jgi:hypothetical protein
MRHERRFSYGPSGKSNAAPEPRPDADRSRWLLDALRRQYDDLRA